MNWFLLYFEYLTFLDFRLCRETVRKLYLVTCVAFFDPGSVLQLSLSVVVSVLALIYHVSANPFKQQFLNGMIMWDFFSVFSRFILPFC